MKRHFSLSVLGLVCFGFYPFSARGEQIGQWQLDVDRMASIMNQLRTEVDAAHALFTIQAATFTIKYDGNAVMSDESKRATHARWSRAIVDALKLSGLRQMDDANSTPQQRQQLVEMRAKLINRMPFGLRSRAQNEINNISVLMDDKMAPCTRIDGAYGATVMPILPRTEVASEFGSFGVFVFGMGSCGERGGYAEQRLGYTFDRVQRTLVRDLKTHGEGE